MKNTVLLEALSADDRAKIESYVNKYGVIKDDFIGIDKWLQFWSYSKQKLFKLLGNQLIYKTKINYKKEFETLKKEMSKLLTDHPFRTSYHLFFISKIVKYCEDGVISVETKRSFSRLSDLSVFVNDSVEFPIKMQKPGCKKILQIQKGMKPMRAFSNIISYFKDDFQFKDFEDFRIKHSMVLNDKHIKGNLCISIHPLDFMTMSDNANDWSSCMSWKEDGCYHLGTVEMMNSNNVLCCYVDSGEPFSWNDRDTGQLVDWNSKKFRVLTYVTKDIIVNGKSYPLQNVDLVKIIINTIRDLAKKNLNWTYSFGPELYKDMIHINYASDMYRNKQWIQFGDAKKHNIIFDTNAMYNDMFNDNNREYWCYRNKVKRNKVINLSGKANCLCCNGDVKEFSNDEYEYNDRFNNSGSVICLDCREKYKCDCCYDYDMTAKKYEITFSYSDGTTLKKRICQKCWDRYAKICPDCGEPYLNEWRSYYNNNNIFRRYGEIVSQDYSKKNEYLLKTVDTDVYKTKEELFAACNTTVKDYTEEKNLRLLPVENLTFHNCEPCRIAIDNIKKIKVDIKKFWSRDPSTIELIPAKYVVEKYGFHALKTPKWSPDFVFKISKN